MSFPRAWFLTFPLSSHSFFFFFFHGPDGDDDGQVGVIGLLGSWERLFSPVEYPHIIVKLVPHIYQRVIDLAFLHSASSVWLSDFGKIPKQGCDVYGSPRVVVVPTPGCYRTRGSVLDLCTPSMLPSGGVAAPETQRRSVSESQFRRITLALNLRPHGLDRVKHPVHMSMRRRGNDQVFI